METNSIKLFLFKMNSFHYLTFNRVKIGWAINLIIFFVLFCFMIILQNCFFLFAASLSLFSLFNSNRRSVVHSLIILKYVEEFQFIFTSLHDIDYRISNVNVLIQEISL